MIGRPCRRFHRNPIVLPESVMMAKIPDQRDCVNCRIRKGNRRLSLALGRGWPNAARHERKVSGRTRRVLAFFVEKPQSEMTVASCHCADVRSGWHELANQSG